MSTITTARKLRPPVKTHGGKAYLARRIAARMPAHEVYVEPFIGGGSVLLNKPPAEREIAGDVNSELIHFWTTLQRDAEGLGRAAALPYTPEVFADAAGWSTSDDPTTRAVGFLVRNRMSRGGLGRDFAWSDRLRGKRRPGGPIPGDVNAWETSLAELPAVAERIAAVELHHANALDLIARHDSPRTLFYLDPPYQLETRTARRAYAHEVAAKIDEDRLWHLAFLKAAVSCQGAVMISGYPSPLYAEQLAGWTLHEFDMPNHAGQGKAKQRRTECLWVKPAGS